MVKLRFVILSILSGKARDCDVDPHNNVFTHGIRNSSKSHVTCSWQPLAAPSSATARPTPSSAQASDTAIQVENSQNREIAVVAVGVLVAVCIQLASRRS